jgi:hypothetical protein
MRIKLNKKGQANPAPTYGRGWLALFTAVALLCTAIFAQETTPVPAVEPAAEKTEAAPEAAPAIEPEAPKSEPIPAAAPAAPKPMSLAEALSGSSLPKGCTEDFTSVMGKDGFSMAKFMTDLPVDAAKVKLQMKSPFGKPKDGDKTGSGLTVGCIKALPESPTEIASILKDIGLKMGLSAVAEGAADNSIPTNIDAKAQSGSGSLKAAVLSASLIAIGLQTVIYGFMQEIEASNYVDSKNGKAAEIAADKRNMSYIVGSVLLAGGLSVVIFF